jgi:hypothetical protein
MSKQIEEVENLDKNKLKLIFYEVRIFFILYLYVFFHLEFK